MPVPSTRFPVPLFPVLFGLFLLVSGCTQSETPTAEPTDAMAGDTRDKMDDSMAKETTDTITKRLPDKIVADPQLLMAAALRELFVGEATSVEAMGESGDPSYIPVLVELQRFPWYYDSSSQAAIGSSLVMLGQGYGEDPVPDGFEWEGWVSWLGTHPDVTPPHGFAAWKGQLFTTLVDPDIGDFFYDGVKTRIRLEEIVWGGVVKDGIPDLRYAPVIAAREASYLDASDRVFGVSINGKHRAYPLRILNAHEMANDVVGGVPIALAY